MNDITIALKTAGVKLPSQMKRIWTYIKDHPNTTRDTLGKALNLPAGNISSLLTQMLNRKMITRTEDSRRIMRSGISKFETVWVYNTDMGEYEILPVCKKKAEPARSAPGPVLHVTPPPVPALLTTRNIPDMKLSDARDLYLELKKYFGGEL